jgi:hypothetical protein
MRICLNKNIELLSTLTKDEVIEKISQNIEYVGELRITGIRHNSFRNYEGYINKDEIKFRRILKSGANSFIPQISGRITDMDNKTYLQLNARLHKVIEGFVIGFNCFLILLLIIGLINMDITAELGFHIQFLTGLLVMIVIANGMPRLFFNYELYRLEKDFRKILVCNDFKPSNDSRLNRFIENKIMIF